MKEFKKYYYNLPQENQNLMICLFVSFIIFLSTSINVFTQDYHLPVEVEKKFKKSKIKYILEYTEEKFEYLDTSKNEFSPFTFINLKNQNNKDTTYFISINNKIKNNLNKAIYDIENGNTIIGRQVCKLLLKENDTLYFLNHYIGLSYYLENNLDSAKFYFIKSINRNISDYYSHKYLSKIYQKVDSLETALKHIGYAHILNKKDEDIFSDFINLLNLNNKMYQSWVFNPQVRFIEKSKDTIIIRTHKEWEGYAISKALIKYEPNYTDIMGDNWYDIYINGETESLKALIYFYDGEISNSKTKEIKYANQIFQTGYYNNFMSYEIILNQFPWLSYTYSKSKLELLYEYLIKDRNKALIFNNE